jgi:diguanylate cyclase (GGDEF)-like protein
LGRDWFAFWDPDETRSRARSAFMNLINSVNNTPDMRTIRFRGSVKTKNGRVRLIEWRSAFGFDPVEDQFLCLSSGLDITEKVAAERRAEYLATHDEVTGLPNRRWFMDEVPRSLIRAARRREKVAVLYLDLDGFKSVNDRFGHHVGDAVLSDVADTITATVRSADSVARVGGDEFVILLENVASTSAARSVGHKIIDTIAGLVVNAEGARIGVSVGLATYPDDATDAETLLQTADQAMYAAKRAGGSQLRSVSSPVLQ